MSAALVIVAFLGIALAWAVLTYNRLVALRNRAQGAWSDIDVQLKRRHDLVNNLVETVKGYARHERATLESVVEARNSAAEARAAGDPTAAGAAEITLTGRLRQLFALAESYPDLKASDNFLDLQEKMSGIEDALQNARRYYNAVVRDLNTRIQSFPDTVLARAAGFAEFSFFELDDAAEAEAPQVDFGTRLGAAR